MLRYSLKSLDELDALEEQEKLGVLAADTQPPTLELPSPVLIDYSNYPLNLSLVSALAAFNPTNPYQSDINLFSTLDSSRILRGVLGS